MPFSEMEWILSYNFLILDRIYWMIRILLNAFHEKAFIRAAWRVQIGITFPDVSGMIKVKGERKRGDLGRWRLEVGGK